MKLQMLNDSHFLFLHVNVYNLMKWLVIKRTHLLALLSRTTQEHIVKWNFPSKIQVIWIWQKYNKDINNNVINISIWNSYQTMSNWVWNSHQMVLKLLPSLRSNLGPGNPKRADQPEEKSNIVCNKAVVLS